MGRYGFRSKEVLLRRLPYVLGAIAMFLGIAGFLNSAAEVSLKTLFASCYTTIQLFFFNVPADALSNWMLRCAAVLAPLATATAAVAVFGSWARGFFLRRALRRRPPSDLLIGGGNAGHQLAQAIAKLRDRGRAADPYGILVLDADPGCRIVRDPPLADAEHLSFLQGSGTDLRDLESAQALRARHAWIVCGDDETNLQVLSTMSRALQAGGGSGSAIDWYVEVDNPELLRFAVDFHQLPAGCGELHFFSLERLLARRAVQSHPVHCPSTPHIAVVGASPLAEAVILQAVQQLVFSETPTAALRVSWFARDVETCRGAIVARHPVLDPSLAERDPSLRPLLPVAQITTYESDELAISSAAWREAQQAAPFTAIYVAVVGDERLAVATQRVIALREYQAATDDAVPKVVICASQAASVGGQSSTEEKLSIELSEKLWGKPLLLKDCKYLSPADVDLDGYPDSQNDEMAKIINFHYKGKPGETPESLWKATKEWERSSSRLAADHQRIIKAQWSSISGDRETKLDALARLEHRRFVVERLMGGWLPAPGTISKDTRGNSGLQLDKKGKDFLRMNTDLCRYDLLSNESRDYTKRTIEWLVER